MSGSARTLRLPLAGGRSYDIHIGKHLLAGLGGRLTGLLPGRRAAVVSNETVAPLYLDVVSESLRQAGFSVLPVILPDGEIHKEWPVLQTIFDALIENCHERESLIVALGGGVVGDMAGFAASAYLRGVPYVQVPTTLLAQVDSSVGGKTGINHPLGKNLIGAFYQPRMVLIDVGTLGTLPHPQLLAGMAEVIKYGVIWDQELFRDLETHLEPLLSLQSDVVCRVVERCCAIKAEIVAQDEHEAGKRALLNLGHTFGHAVETLTDYKGFLHGEAVAVGMALAADLSVRLGLCDPASARRVTTLLERAGLPVQAPRFSVERYLSAMARDKKVQEGRLRFVLMEEVGKARITAQVPHEHLVATLEHGMAHV